jgi:Icc-related predicted phosphoesterase
METGGCAARLMPAAGGILHEACHAGIYLAARRREARRAPRQDGGGQMDQERQTVRVATVGDIHCGRTSKGELQPIFAAASELADVLVLAGDLTDYGLPEEAELLADELKAARIPVVGVLGNHDYESGQMEEVCRILGEAGVTILDGDAVELAGVGFAGVKGFGGGFGRGTLGHWGEPAIKAFVQEAIDESLKLEQALSRLRTPGRVAVLHYAPIQATVEGEPPEIFPYLGCSRLEEPLGRFPVDAVIHGHAHGGSPEGRTAAGVPVYNVSLSLLRRHFPDAPPLRILELPVA